MIIFTLRTFVITLSLVLSVIFLTLFISVLTNPKHKDEPQTIVGKLFPLSGVLCLLCFVILLFFAN